MIPLTSKGISQGISEPIVAVVSRNPMDSGCILLWDEDKALPPGLRSRGVLTPAMDLEGLVDELPAVVKLNTWGHLVSGDIVALHRSGRVQTLFRVESPQNSLFITDRCNSNCLMCSQPPKNLNDLDELFDLNSQLIRLIPKGTGELGITGGEPTLLGMRLPGLIHQLKEELPDTALHMLTNGRAFAWQNVVKAYADIQHPDLMFGIPLYSDYAPHHDYIVQAKGAFFQTVKGFHNLARAGLLLEIRIVLHRLTISRLQKLVQFLYQNFPFTAHVALMGMEFTGYVPHNRHLLSIDPMDFQEPLEEAVTYLDDMGLCVSLYNLPHCLIPRSLWQFSRRSISDWKQGYLPECQRCAVKESCAGIFETSRVRSPNIKAVSF